jgi:ABC-2 type transport system permease protein
VNFDPRSVRVVAEKDFRDAIRSRALLLLTTVFVVFFAAAAFFFADQIQQAIDTAAASNNTTDQQAAAQVRQRLTSNSFLEGLMDVTRLFVPLIGIVVAYASVIGERESGTLKLLLSLPHSRLSVVLGKVAGRGAVVGLPVLLGFLVAAPVFPLLGVRFEPISFALFALITVVLGATFVSLAVGVSAASDTNRRVIVTLVGLYAVFTLLWGRVTNTLVGQVADRTDLGRRALIELNVAVKHFNPIALYESLARGRYGSAEVQVSLFSRPPLRELYVQQYGSLPVYLTDAAFVVYLLLWLVVPLALGVLAFEKLDL